MTSPGYPTTPSRNSPAKTSEAMRAHTGVRIFPGQHPCALSGFGRFPLRNSWRSFIRPESVTYCDSL